MTTNLMQAVNALETLYPLRYAESWDHPGLIVGDLCDPVDSIVFAADPTMDVVEDAIASGANLLVTHHPLFFRAVHEVSGLGVHGAIVNKLVRAHCGLWVGHTNADAAWRGVGMAAADAFGLQDQQPLKPIDDPSTPHAVGLGRVGVLPEPISLEQFAQRVAAALPSTQYGIQVSGPKDASIRTVAVLPGSGDSEFARVNALGVDCYVTSDLRHHPATDQMQQAIYESRMRAEGIALGNGDAQTRPVLINTPHSAIESLWFRYALTDVPDAIELISGSRPAARWNSTPTDPWDFTI
ncbi:Nif3-like dinuclear metal center hexameric protein [Bifidobacterium gallicum]|uniref:GTP cyclohydrolase 1 type 2 homolog n=1 Tax=Bifidobacterium gallicum DSM 20093 = LMG 11596 TaxID=561180 RepID=D1NS65_9BIFI|nr:Nif3-like dinuclear metal center hexameric protein [Bifidobacterium gallicum]EFA23517.1 putative dinuclear metal center protein, YbgI family [Bifidobacterium gallicum DSM 20093 = LMG 11596]KFI58595.1 PadR family transcriptional regulator [Bifidobacterium gallicum DSM 20093 = LMG 11596]